jgi:seryl-tRNA synthetase
MVSITWHSFQHLCWNVPASFSALRELLIMIDLHDLRSRPEQYQKACDDKRIQFSISEFLKLDAEYRRVRSEVEGKRAEQNAVSKEIPKLQGTDKEHKLAQMKQLAEALKALGQELKELEEQWTKAQLRIPSIPLASVPVGKDDSENRPVRSWGEARTPDFELKDHVQLSKALDLFDVERGVKIAGARSYFLKGDGARLSHAVMSLAMDHLYKQGYTLMDPPHIVSYQAMMATGYFPGGEEMAYHLDQRDDGFHLIGTAEVPVASYHSDEILSLDELPKRYAGYSPCYRREAGAYGKDTYGLYRVHQFYKVEQVVLCKADAEESMRFHYELLGNAEQVMQMLELPYRVVDVCTGDMGQGQVFKHDIEAWMPSRKAYGETHSCSSFYDFQARRLGTRYKDGNGKNVYCYTLNNTCIASPRILIPLLENHQNRDGSVTVPKALRPYLGGQELIAPKK